MQTNNIGADQPAHPHTYGYPLSEHDHEMSASQVIHEHMAQNISKETDTHNKYTLFEKSYALN